jgi:outer membrane biosynthesis protein TonB
MKLIHVTLAAVVASVMPSASADERAQPKPFTIAFSSEVTPIFHEALRYPAYAGVRNLSGHCEVSFAISTAGEPDAIRVGACSLDAFRAAAKSTVEAMLFAPRTTGIDNVQMEIRWNVGEPARLRTASIR